ncbi:hypothetical protein DM01DRAFT_1366733 [Hesseltinella vesiculosa]|uniref:Uncharacterized protein n=1 Tax=Hesseltinella vesiculosa TaxID=101127 RepID=A0A1X2GKZ9_9FUNG|nr:hypothetical protein DM01DRAFT_1366733 [Hesseltinella vesiculosa]
METHEKILLLRSILGDSIPLLQLEQLLARSNGNVEQAVNRYFMAPTPPQPTRSDQSKSTKVLASKRPSDQLHLRPSALGFYIGDMVISGWSTSSGVASVKPGDQVILGRNTPISLSFSGKRQRTQQPNPTNTIVRFWSKSGSEIGRLPREVGHYVARLIDYQLCDFKATILLHLQCYISKNAFSKPATTPSVFQPPSSSRKDNDDDTLDVAQRQRSIALLSLIRAVGLCPTRTALRQSGNSHLEQITQSLENIPKLPNSDESEEGQENAEEVKEVSDDQLDTIYEQAQRFDEQISPMQQPSTMALTLKSYQQRALSWMVAKESVQQDNDIDVRSMHPLFEAYDFPTDPAGSQHDQPKQFYLNPYSGGLTLDFPETNSRERGGILADEMGLGKTIEMLSLIHAQRFRKDDPSTPMPPAEDKRHSSPTTLVICPNALLSQWKNELLRGSKEGTLTVDTYFEGNDRSTNITQRLCRWDGSAPDVVLTTYGVIRSEYTRNHTALTNINFWRVVLDEAHTIKNRASQTSRACCALKAKRRWALTGTPIQNKLDDLFALVRFLHVEPWSNYMFWRAYITIPFEKKDKAALQTVKTVLEPLVLRRTKNMRDHNNNPIVAIPSKTINVEYLELSEPERDVYDCLYTDSKTRFNLFCASGTVLHNYASILQMLTRLRQASCHPYLVLGNKEATTSTLKTDEGGRISLQSLLDRYNQAFSSSSSETKHTRQNSELMDIDSPRTPSSFGAGILKDLMSQSPGDDASSKMPEECPICFEPTESMILLPCMHMLCRDCVNDCLGSNDAKGKDGECPICRHNPIHESDLVEVSKTGDSLDIRHAVGGYRKSTKINALLSHLKVNMEQSRRTVVYSQFTSFLDLIGVALDTKNIPFVRYDGAMTRTQRDNAVAKFTSNADPSAVMLISLKAGGVGLNLTCASRIVLMDPWWNFATEAQAIDRVHRLGQTEEVIVTRFIIKDTVEEHMLAIQKRKQVLMTELYKSQEEQKAQRLHDIHAIFGGR